MCGIAGVVSNLGVDPEVVRRMRDTMPHRGPDGRGMWVDSAGTVALAHLRLAIVDLSPAGHQPMCDEFGQFVIVFNGEIYNFPDLKEELFALGCQFRTSTDTEVILHAYRIWGEACVERLNGMFAFAIYDLAKRTLFAARDRAGEKPFYYSHEGGTLRFASELKAMMTGDAGRPVLDYGAFNHFLAFGYVPRHLCIIKGVQKLLPGHTLTFELDTKSIQVRRYWSLPEPSNDGRETSPEDLLCELESLLSDAVRRQLVADVPVGVMLSGGVDSSLVTALAARASATPVSTFTITFPNNAAFDESAFARVVAQQFSTRHTELPGQEATPELLPKLAEQYDEPFGDSSAIPTYLISRLIRSHATVALAGDGGDELFAGYQYYNWLHEGARIRRYVPGFIRTPLARMAGEFLPSGFRGRNHIAGLGGDDGWGLAHVNLFFDLHSRRKLLAPQSAERIGEWLAPEVLKSGLAEKRTITQRATRADFQMYLPDDLLVKVDRASMLNSLEVRAPLLDFRVVEFAFGRVPDQLRGTRKARKVLLRRLAKKILPSALDLNRKQGFSVPLTQWIDGAWERRSNPCCGTAILRYSTDPSSIPCWARSDTVIVMRTGFSPLRCSNCGDAATMSRLCEGISYHTPRSGTFLVLTPGT